MNYSEAAYNAALEQGYDTFPMGRGRAKPGLEEANCFSSGQNVSLPWTAMKDSFPSMQAAVDRITPLMGTQLGNDLADAIYRGTLFGDPAERDKTLAYMLRVSKPSLLVSEDDECYRLEMHLTAELVPA